jgi:hypothetical protein
VPVLLQVSRQPLLLVSNVDTLLDELERCGMGWGVLYLGFLKFSVGNTSMEGFMCCCW